MSNRSGVRAALLVSPGGLPDWLADAIQMALVHGVEVPLILCCENPMHTRRPLKHLFYYALNLLVMRRGDEERVRTIDELGLAGAARFAFRAEPSARRGWQRIPDAVGVAVREHRCDVVIKAGMGLVENPEASGAPLGMLSYHHGDPSCYRGRPAGFWEMMNGESTMGMMVQRLNDKLDAGVVLAFGRTKVYPHSYGLTLSQVRRSSSALLLKAIRAAQAQTTVEVPTKGKNFRLPSNSQVCVFLASLWLAKLRRIYYGAFMQKEWHVGTGPAVKQMDGESRLSEPMAVPTPKGYVFLADCFWSQDGHIYAEALKASRGVAEIIKVRPGCHEVVSNQPDQHWSYPFSFLHAGTEYLLPEVAQWSPPFMLSIQDGAAERIYLKGLEGLRLVDPTLFQHEGHWYLFAGEAPLANQQLNLWVSASGPAGPYDLHPFSPIVVDTTCARMAGAIIHESGRLVRLGQDFSDGYGSAIATCEITQLTPSVYHERKIGRISMASAKGPHTYVVRDEKALFDWYEESFSLFAGCRRAMAKLVSR